MANDIASRTGALIDNPVPMARQEVSDSDAGISSGGSVQKPLVTCLSYEMQEGWNLALDYAEAEMGKYLGGAHRARIAVRRLRQGVELDEWGHPKTSAP